MNCHKVARLIPLILSGELTGRAADSLKRHLATCIACTREYNGYQRSFDALRSLHTDEAVPNTWVGFNSRVRVAIENAAVERRGILPLPQGLYIRVGSVAACCIVVTLTIAVAAGLFAPPEPQPGNAEGLIAIKPKEQEIKASEGNVPNVNAEQYPYSLEEVTVTVGYGDEL